MAKKAASKKSPAKKAAADSKAKAPAKKTTAKKKAPAKKLAKKVTMAKPLISKPLVSSTPTPVVSSGVKPKKLPAAFLKKQQQKLLDLRDNLVDQMNGIARETIRGGGDDGSAFGMHQADAGSDSYDRDFALNLLSQEQDALAEIDEALQRIVNGSYGICDVSGDMIPEMRLEAMPFARRTVSCQEKMDQEESMGMHRQPVTSLFGLDEKDKTVADS